ncbi:glycosyltransferase family 2 protein [uncultured Draconibacterium sp.]|uniref:glycosyltransferase family 2 protein n=1 Tax=uncultured Draconibacterium sp. TaxID=1573823 RepID=UPI0025E4039B|nr:glycosyltransferase family 2 protein [uncultured Draconibacterium sp.]
MSTLPKISVITVVFNAVELLEQTIKSIICQSYANLEYIVIDGSSTDGTVDIIKKYDKAITHWISEKDTGIYDAMNKGLKMASGDYVIFINAGDMLYACDTLAKIPFAAHPEADVFYGETVIISDKTGEDLGLRKKVPPRNLSWKHYQKGMVVCHQSIFIKKSITTNYNTSYRLSADVEWVILALKKAQKVVYVDCIISRFLSGGASRKMQKLSLKERFSVMRKYFGLIPTVFSHIGFIFDTLAVKLKLRPLYRKNYFKPE